MDNLHNKPSTKISTKESNSRTDSNVQNDPQRHSSPIYNVAACNMQPCTSSSQSDSSICHNENVPNLNPSKSHSGLRSLGPREKVPVEKPTTSGQGDRPRSFISPHQERSLFIPSSDESVKDIPLPRDVKPRARGEASYRRQQHSYTYVKRSFYDIRVDVIILKCANRCCPNWNQYSGLPVQCPCGEVTVRSNHITERISIDVVYHCSCGHVTKIRELKFFGYVICLKCYKRPEYSEKMNLKLEPISIPPQYKPLHLVNHGRIRLNQRRNTIEPVDDGHKEFYDENGGYKSTFFPSKGISPWVFHDYISGKSSQLTTYIWLCDECKFYNEFEFVKRSICLNCDSYANLKNYLRTNRIRPTAEVSLTIQCSRCCRVNDIRDWTEKYKFICPNTECNFNPGPNEELTIKRTLSNLNGSNVTSCSLLAKRQCFWTYKVEPSLSWDGQTPLNGHTRHRNRSRQQEELADFVKEEHL